MQYSFTKPRKKYLVSSEVRLVLIFFSMTLFVLFSTYFILLYKTYSFESTTLSYQHNIQDINQSLYDLNQEIMFISIEKEKAEEVVTKNTILHESIKNLFDLVPNRIVLSRAEMEKNSLILYGITPNKEVCQFMLHAPLRSIFHKTYSSFYPIENSSGKATSGWLNFVSKNYLNDNTPTAYDETLTTDNAQMTGDR
jgi:hypothetical protein